jgi:hypothetical protein
MTGLAHAPDFLQADATTTTRGGERLRGLLPVAGRIAAQIFYVAVTLFLFANLQDRSETITVALIGLVFASLRASTLANACAQRRVAFLLESEIKSVRRTMAQEIPSLPVSDIDLDHALDAQAKRLRIEYAGVAVIGAICFYHLGIAILYGMAYQELLGLH